MAATFGCDSHARQQHICISIYTEKNACGCAGNNITEYHVISRYFHLKKKFIILNGEKRDVVLNRTMFISQNNERNTRKKRMR